jgi:precorrin-2 dehydrogenase/sirohydrochlorin ferrochelatase
MKLYPVMLNINGRQAIVIGGGEVAARKVSDLLDAGATVKVISPEFNREIFALSNQYSPRLELVKKVYEKNDLSGAVLVFSATNDPQVNALVFAEAEDKCIMINAVDDPPNCSFYVPSFVRKGDLIFSLSTGGASPAMAARLRREIEKHIPSGIDMILEKLKQARTILKGDRAFSGMDSSQRGFILKQIVNDDKLLEELRSCSIDELAGFLVRVKDSGFKND